MKPIPKLFIAAAFWLPLVVAPVSAQQPAGDSAGASMPGTLAGHLATNADGRARGFSGVTRDLVVIRAPNSTNLNRLTKAVWSTNCWLAGVQGLSATPIGFSNNFGRVGLPTMVSPRHYLFATHTHPEVNTLAFLGSNNIVYFRTTLQRADVAFDTSVGILDADLPASVGFMPVVPPDLLRYLPTNGAVVQGIGMDQQLRLFSQPMTFGNPIYPLFVCWNSKGTIPLGLGANWGQSLRTGDSSAPEMLLIGNQLVLLSHNYSVSVGPNYALQINAINEKLHYLSTNNNAGSDYRLTLFPLTTWPAINP